MDLQTLKLMLYYLIQPLLNRRCVPKLWSRPGRCSEVSLSDEGKTASFVFPRARLTIEAMSPVVFKVLFSREKDPDYFSWSVIRQEREKLVIREQGDCVSVSTADESGLRVVVDKRNGKITIRKGETILHRDTVAAGWRKGWVSCKKESPEPEYYAGFGQKTGLLFKNNRRLIMWNTDNANVMRNSDPIYQSCPFYMGLRKNGTAHGIFFDNTFYTLFHGGKVSASPRTFYAAAGGPLCYYVLGGPTAKDVVQQFTSLTGRYPLPPRWVLGHHHSRWSNNESTGHLRKLAADFREKDVPCEVLHIDIGHMEGFRCFTWSRERFHDAGETIRELHEKRFRVVIITDPGIKKDDTWPLYREGEEKSYFCKDKKGNTFIGPVWPGQSAFVDYSYAPACRWWGEQYSHYTSAGIDGFWNDMNEPSVFIPRRTMPDTVVHRGGGEYPETDHKRHHNIYSLLMAKATYEGLSKIKKGKRLFMFTRSSFAGIQRYASSWTGDNRSNWTHLQISIPMVLNMGLSGQTMTGPDIGGFWGNSFPELMKRWFEVGIFYPFCRNHTSQGTVPQEVWCFDEETLSISRDYLFRRYQLLPYLYTWLRFSCESGIPLMRPLFLEFPHDMTGPNRWVFETEFLCGPYILVAPILWPGKTDRQVYLPAGCRWYDYWSCNIYDGGKWYTIDAPIQKIPLFIRAGAVIPMGPPVSVSDESVEKELILNIYTEEKIDGEVYIDDGETLDYNKGAFSLIDITGLWKEKEIRFHLSRKEGKLTPEFYKHPELVLRVSLHVLSLSPLEVFLGDTTIEGGTRPLEFTVKDGWCEVRVKNIVQHRLPLDVVLRFE